MCFVLPSYKILAKKRIAKKDIKVYKYVVKLHENECESYWFDFRYRKDELNKEEELKIEKSHSNILEIFEGYHSYIQNGGISNALFIIPKDSEYYENTERGERVSNQIIFKKFIT